MASQPHTTENMQQCSDYPTSPWTETFRACMAEPAQSQPAKSETSRQPDSEMQLPTQEALSTIYNQGY